MKRTNSKEGRKEEKKEKRREIRIYHGEIETNKERKKEKIFHACNK